MKDINEELRIIIEILHPPEEFPYGLIEDWFVELNRFTYSNAMEYGKHTR